MSTNFLIGLALIALTAGTSACESKHKKSHADSPNVPGMTGAADSDGTHTGAHIYQCPMHPEVTSAMPGKCPKCGMSLQHTDNVAGTGKTYEMAFTSDPAKPEAGKPVTLRFQPHDQAAPTAPVPLAVVHEKKIHLIIVSRDLSEFYHEHPEYGADGSYTTTFRFPHGGEYVLYQDYTPEGDSHQLGRQDVTVAGTAPAAVKYDRDVMTWKGTAGYQADLTFDKPAQVGQPLAVQVKLTHSGQPITDLEPYLGALGHMVIISEDTKQYLHVHPQDAPDHGPVVSFHTAFERAGRYRVFLQFNHGGQVHTADFVVNVAPATASKSAAPAAAYGCPMHADVTSDKPGTCSKCGMDLEKRA